MIAGGNGTCGLGFRKFLPTVAVQRETDQIPDIPSGLPYQRGPIGLSGILGTEGWTGRRYLATLLLYIDWEVMVRV